MHCRETYKRDFSPIAKKRIKENKCPSCGKPKTDWMRRTDWMCCSVDCTKTFWKEHDKSMTWEGQRLKALRRDDYTCRMCGKRFAYHSEHYNLDFEKDGCLIGDHITPVSIGGDCFDLDNIQTLCIDCNKIKTKKDMKAIADYRRIENKQSKNQILGVIN